MLAYMHPYIHVCTHAFLSVMQQVDSLDESAVGAKLATYSLHQATLDFTLENFDTTVAKYKAMLEDA